MVLSKYMSLSLEDRILASEQRFNELARQRDDVNTEMTKIQGEWRLLQELKDAETKPDEEATVIEAVPEEGATS